MVVTSNRIDIDRQQVLHNIGYGADCKLPARISSLIDEYAENAYQLIEPSYSCVIRDIKLVQGSSVFIEGSIVFRSEVIARLLGLCRQVAVLVVTIGGRLEEMAGHLGKDGLILQSAVLDAIGSDAVESVADLLQTRIADRASAQGLTISRRFSPGYCDWSISQQKAVFRALGEDRAGVELTGGCLMVPRKSISGIIGIGPAEAGVAEYNPCPTCRKRDCRGRR